MTDRASQILQAALALVDEEGLDALSMRTLARRVGVSAMALYPHIGGKEALLDGLVDIMLAELLPALERNPGQDWRGRLQDLAHGLRALAHRHPNAFGLLLARPSVTPDAVRTTVAVEQALRDAGVPAEHRTRLERMLSTFVLGFAASEVNGRFQGADVDWDAEFTADLAELEIIIETLARSVATV